MDFEAMLRFLGLDSYEIRNLIETASREQWTPDQFSAAIYSSDTFKREFPGIFRADGSMIMDPFQYRATADQYQAVANRYGISLDPARVGTLIHKNISVNEFADRGEAIARIEENKQYFEAFNKVLEARGMEGFKSKEDMADFLLGKKSAKFYDVWEEVQIGGAAKMAGVNLSGKMIRSISNKIPGADTMDPAALQQHFQNLAQSLRTALPQSKIQGYGLTKKDLVELEFGGPRQAAIADKVQRVMAQYQGNMEQNKELGNVVGQRNQNNTLSRQKRG